MQKNKILGLLVLLVVLAAAGWQLVSFSNQLAKTEINPVDKPNNQQSVELIIKATNTALLVINNNIDDPQNFNLEVASTTTAFDLLKIAAASSNITLKFTEYEIGVFIEQIGDQKNGDNNKYWLYYIDDQMPMVAADKQLISPSDTISFRFEQSTF